MSLEQLARGISDEPFGLSDARHDVVARIRALRAVDALHLETVADVDAGRTGLHAGAAVDAVAGADWTYLALHARLAARRVVRDDHRLPIEQHRLHPSIRARHETRLFAEVGEVREHRDRHSRHDQERRRMLGR